MGHRIVVVAGHLCSICAENEIVAQVTITIIDELIDVVSKDIIALLRLLLARSSSLLDVNNFNH